VKYIIATATSSCLILRRLFSESASDDGLLDRLVTPARNYMNHQGYFVPMLFDVDWITGRVSSSLRNKLVDIIKITTCFWYMQFGVLEYNR